MRLIRPVVVPNQAKEDALCICESVYHWWHEHGYDQKLVHEGVDGDDDIHERIYETAPDFVKATYKLLGRSGYIIQSTSWQGEEFQLYPDSKGRWAVP